MSFSLNDFRNKTGGFSRNSHFVVSFGEMKTLGIPEKLDSQYGNKYKEHLQFFVSATNVPARTLETQKINVQYGQPGINIAKDINYAPWTVTFYSDDGLLVRSLFLNWQETVYQTKTQSYTTCSRYKSDEVDVTLLTGENKPLQSYKFKGLWPSEVGAISLQQQDAGITTFDVTFSYDYFIVNNTDGLAIAGAIENKSLPAEVFAKQVQKNDAIAAQKEAEYEANFRYFNPLTWA